MEFATVSSTTTLAVWMAETVPTIAMGARVRNM